MEDLMKRGREKWGKGGKSWEKGEKEKKGQKKKRNEGKKITKYKREKGKTEGNGEQRKIKKGGKGIRGGELSGVFLLFYEYYHRNIKKSKGIYYVIETVMKVLNFPY